MALIVGLISQCLEDGAVKFALKLFCKCQIYHHVTKNKVGGIVGKVKINRDAAVYNYSKNC